MQLNIHEPSWGGGAYHHGCTYSNKFEYRMRCREPLVEKMNGCDRWCAQSLNPCQAAGCKSHTPPPPLPARQQQTIQSRIYQPTIKKGIDLQMLRASFGDGGGVQVTGEEKIGERDKGSPVLGDGLRRRGGNQKYRAIIFFLVYTNIYKRGMGVWGRG